ncbi:MAG: hypothetical protein ACXABY_36425 [Candidatus Thorarchaeota archaeon]|jgi:hypothetical protein
MNYELPLCWSCENAIIEIDLERAKESKSMHGKCPWCGSEGHLYSTIQATYFPDIMSDWDLAGQGEPHHDCGKIYSAAWCDDHKEETTKYFKKSCGRAECPTCNIEWAKREAVKITRRMMGYKRLLQKKKKRYAILSHASFSAPPSEYGKSYRELRRQLYDHMKEAGVKGANVIFHPFRFKDEKGERVDWKHNSLNPEAIEPIIEAKAVYSPHWHVVYTGKLMKSDALEERTGWVYRKFGILDKKADVQRCVQYQLTHMGLSEYEWRKKVVEREIRWTKKRTTQSITYMGECSYSNMVKDGLPDESEEPVMCPVKGCGKQMSQHWYIETIIDGEEYKGFENSRTEPLHRKIVKQKYKFRRG